MSEPNDGEAERDVLDDPEFRERLLAHARACVSLNTENQTFLATQVERLKAILDADVHESVHRAAGHVNKTLLHHIGRQKWLARGLAQGIAAIESAASLRDTAEEGNQLVDIMKYQRTDDLNESEVLASELTAAVDAVEFASRADHSEELRKASGAMERILGGVTELREMGFGVGEIQAMVDDFITQKTKHDLRRDFSLLAPVISDNDGKGTRRNKRMVAKRREELLEKDEWVLRFLNEFWCKYWTNAFERSLPEDREVSIACARDVIPDILDAEKEPQGVDILVSEVWSWVKKRRERGEAKVCRVRLHDEHIVVALDRLVQSGGSRPTAVVRIAGEEAIYWTRQRAEAAGLEIAPSRLTLVAEDNRESKD